MDIAQHEAPNAAAPPLTLEAFAVTEAAPRIVPAAPLRNWMETVSGRHAYRCLPLSIANAYGWEILCPYDLAIDWNGGPLREDITVRRLDSDKPPSIVHSNFAHGIITFYTHYIFRTPPGWNLFATGPLNNPKRGITPLSGIIETDWLPYPFTMNWTLTDPGTIVFEYGEPFCVIFPVQQETVSRFQPVVKSLDEDSDLKRDYLMFLRSRQEFLRSLEACNPDAVNQPWQKYYFRGQLPDGRSHEDHVNKLRLALPLDFRDDTA